MAKTPESNTRDENGTFVEELDRRNAELLKIKRRRSTQFGGKNTSNTHKTLVGLALSGGGVRSAALSLGAIQALHHHGVFRFVDYLSTVSGGAYAGSYLSSAIVSAQEETRTENDTPLEESNRKPFDIAMNDIASGPNDRQPQRMLEFIFHRLYLRKPWEFLNRYLIGLLLLWVVVGSGLVAVASAIAYVFRSLDHPMSRTWLEAIGFEGDFQISIFPAVVLAALWIITWVVSYFKNSNRPKGRLARMMFYAFAFAGAVALVNLLSTGDIYFGAFFTPDETTVHWVTRTALLAIVSTIAIGLLPYLSPQRLFRSGVSPQSAGEKYTFWFATRALAFGLPFLLVVFFMRENISGSNERRGAEFRYSSEVVGWYKADVWVPFWRRLATEGDPVARRLWNGRTVELDGNILRRFEEETAATSTPSNDEYQDDSKYPVSISEAFHVLESAAERYDAPVGFDDDDLLSFVEARNDLQSTRNAIIRSLNDALTDETFFREFYYDDEVEEAIPIEHVASILPSEWRREGEELYTAMKHATEFAGSRGSRHSSVVEGLQDHIVRFNRRLLIAYSDGEIRRANIVFSGIVLRDDQRFRASCFWWSLALFTFSGLTVNLNATSLHNFYRRRLSRMWLKKQPSGRRDYRLKQMATTDSGGPYHLINATALLPRGARETRSYEPRDRFLFSQEFCGSNRLGYLPTGEYMEGQFELADAMAISGAAFTPMQSANPLVIGLMGLANLRLGRWIRNPSQHGKAPGVGEVILGWLPYSPIKFLCSLLSHPEDRRMCFASDGGMYDNLGLEALMKRRCRLMICVDAGQDGKFEFADFAKLQRSVRMRYGIGITAMHDSSQAASFDSLMPSAEPGEVNLISHSHYMVAQVEYPDELGPQTGVLIYIKASLTGDEPVELKHAAQKWAGFPHSSTIDQFYDAGQFESYRLLGRHMLDGVCRYLSRNPIWMRCQDDFSRCIELIVESAQFGLDAPAKDRWRDRELDRVISELCSNDTATQERAAEQVKMLGSEVAKRTCRLVAASVKAESKGYVYSDIAIKEVLLENANAAFGGLIDVVTDSAERSSRRGKALFYLREYYRQGWCLSRFDLAKGRLAVVAADSDENQRFAKRVQAFVDELNERSRVSAHSAHS